MSRGVMTEVIVDIVNKSVRDDRFVEWLWGWLGTKYVLHGAYLRENMTEVVFVLEKDMFTLFTEMYRVISYMKSKLKSEAPVVLCSGDECIDMSDTYYLVLISGYKIRKLKKVFNMIKPLVRKKEVRGIWMMSMSGQIWINIGCHDTMLYTDEVIALIGLLLDRLYRMSQLVVFKEARDYVYNVVDPFAINYNVIELEVEKCGGLIDVVLDGCKQGLLYDEVIWLVYKLLQKVIDNLEDVRRWMKKKYEVEV
jgi:hypothetical protein